MKITICSNTETLRPIWGDIFDDANIYDTCYIDDEIAAHWAKFVGDALDDAGLEWKYESSFQFWHGGPGCGFYCYDGDDARVAEAVAAADAAARELAEREVADVSE